MLKDLYNTDQKIIDGIIVDDELALRVLYKLYFPVVQSFMLSNKGSHDDVADIYQETILAVYHNIKNGVFKKESSLKTYIYAIARRLWFTELKNRNRELRGMADYSQDQEAIQIDFDLIDNRKAQYVMMEKCLHELGEPCKTILEDFYIHHLSMQDISDKMNYTNPENAKNQKYKCLQRLKKVFFEVYKK